MKQCGHCQKEPHIFDQAYSVFTYEYPVTQFIHKLKENKLNNLTQLKQWMTSCYLKYLSSFDIDAILTIPSSPIKTLQRGHQPAATVGTLLSQTTDIPLITNAFRKRWLSKAQKKRSKASRNSVTKFKLNEEALRNLPPQPNVLLVDDVMTTAASLNEASLLLKAYGTGKIYALTIARTPLKH